MSGRSASSSMSVTPDGRPPAAAGRPFLPFEAPRKAAILAAAAASVAVAVAFRLVALRTFQGEIYGDIAIVREYLDLVRSGQWPFHFTLSSGPLYHYLVMPVIAAAGPGYLGMKLASVAVSLGVLAATYALGRRLLGEGLGLLSLCVAGVSSWLLIFSRLGNSQIVVPLLATTSLWLLVRFVEERRRSDLVLSGLVAGLGFYGYPQSFVLAPVLLLTLAVLHPGGERPRAKDLGLFALASLAVALPFARIVARDPANFFSGYIGGKLIPEGGGPLPALIRNLWAAAGSLHVQGDSGFRSNPDRLAHLDPISGVLFLAGVLFWLLPGRRRLAPALFVPFVLLQAPSILVLRAGGEVPSASRTLGAAPIAYVLVASGLIWVFRLLAGRPRLQWAVTAALLAGIAGLNEDRYFRRYRHGLPYDDTPIAALVSEFADGLPAGTDVILLGCCWEGGMPEPKGVQFGLREGRSVRELPLRKTGCDALSELRGPAVLIWDHRHPVPSEELAPCTEGLARTLHRSSRGFPVFMSAPWPGTEAPAAASR